MSKVLITGASGFIGSALALSMVVDHEVVCLSRREAAVDTAFVRGKFYSFEDLLQLDPYQFDVAIHLAGAKARGGIVSDFLMVNVEGTRCLLRYLIERGCRKFVLASSIAAVGVQSPKFRPMQLPIPDEHPCLARNGYGFSKYLMEEVARYYARRNEDVDFINLRLGGVAEDNEVLSPDKVGPLTEWAMARVSKIFVSDTVRVFKLAAEAPYKPGVRILNAVGGQACVEDTVPDIIRAWYPDSSESLDLSYYERPGHERDPLFDIGGVRQEIGFIPEGRYLPATE